MTDLDALLAGVLAAPADDLPRAAYADKCRELGDEDRADYIQIQLHWADNREHGDRCWQEHREPPFGDCPFAAMHERELELWEIAEREKWFADISPLVRAFWNTRGFVSDITCTAEQWVAHGDAIRAAHPVEAVSLTTEPQTALIPIPPGRRGFEGDPAGLHFAEQAIDERWWQFAGGSRSNSPLPTRLEAILSLRWPGVAFTLPEPVSSWNMPGFSADAVRRELQQYREQVAGSPERVAPAEVAAFADDRRGPRVAELTLAEVASLSPEPAPIEAASGPFPSPNPAEGDEGCGS